jgi:hypothetical protein
MNLQLTSLAWICLSCCGRHFEVGLNETEQASELYEGLLERTLHAKVWMSYAQFEMFSSEEGNVVLARQAQYARETSVRDQVVRALVEESQKADCLSRD